MKHIVIFRTSGTYIDYNTYNCQELGLAKALAAKGLKVSLIMGGLVSSHIKVESKGNGVDVYYLKYKAINQSLCVFHGWKELLERLSPDVIQVHEFGMYMSFLVSQWACREGVRCILIQGSYDTTQKLVLKQLECLFNSSCGTRVLKNVDAIGCKTIAAKRYVRKYCDKHVVLTPVGLDESKFNNRPLPEGIKVKYGLGGKKVLLYIGKMEQRRNPMFLVDVMKLLPKDFCLVMVGDGPLLAQMEKRVHNECIDNVLLLGKKTQDALPSIYSAADLFLLASSYEIYGMVLLESMFFGCPVLSTKTAGAETLIKNGKDGVILGGALDANHWADTIRMLFGTQAKIEVMGKCASNKIKDHFIWSKACENFMELYDVNRTSCI